MSIVRHKNTKTGVTYVYESESYWDKEKKQPRSRRKLIGKIDEETGEIVPTRINKEKQSFNDEESLLYTKYNELSNTLEEKDQLIKQLRAENKKIKAENRKLNQEKEETLSILRTICNKYTQE